MLAVGMVQEETVQVQDKRGWWRLIWCHERCHKAVNEKRRQGMSDSANTLGGSLICFKKAKAFRHWMGRAKRPMYVLVADWREGKPCMQTVSNLAAEDRPSVTVIVCDTDRQKHKALQWAKILPAEAGLVHVVETSNIPPSLLGGFVCQHFSEGVSEEGKYTTDRVEAALDSPAGENILGEPIPLPLRLMGLCVCEAESIYSDGQQSDMSRGQSTCSPSVFQSETDVDSDVSDDTDDNAFPHTFRETPHDVSQVHEPRLPF
eukprot:TRINITY_DN71177_c0_g1_i1.p1 TRINITY_DN71177_c0_g1~~TRINITY_DN71177_c0_g1_i1.p1  ORF type:complete len:261 (-),score=38.05 TRINITY_DN71177_c0_g1_i1:52-834(-)